MTKKLNEEHIRVAAYYLWENAGRPEGMEKEFWHQAYSQLMNVKTTACKCASKAKKPVVKYVKACAKKSSVRASVLNTSVVAKPAIKVCAKKASASVVKTSLKPVAKPFYGIKK